ncbi:rna-directed dna polymerase from mobile element jockey-like [Pitangus sulphuratus]|nr:rna-directed dna polymerase from mobile element jockey-like [Pitangus sulphuratus]
MEQLILETKLRHTENKEVIADSQHGFGKGKSRLSNVAAFYDGVRGLVDEGTATDVIYLDLCTAFDTFPNDIVVSKQKRHGFKGWTAWWVRDGHTQRFAVNRFVSKWKPERSGIPQGSVLGTELFNNSVGNRNSGIKGTLSKCANDTKPHGVVPILEGRDVNQRDLDRLR